MLLYMGGKPKMLNCKHPADHLAITETGKNMVSGYCRNCFQTITFAPEKINESINNTLTK